ncbi:MAG TPA: hypothetical protein VFQ54_10900, partial [Thermomicrobiales bacterium]|nr:hypothetical protein [Thermomicrobiales bacterium]
PFWGNTLRWSLPDPENRAFTVSASRDGDDALIAIESSSATGPSINLDGQQVEVTGPDGGSSSKVTLVASGPGQYTARLAGAQPGAYSVTLPSGTAGQTAAYGMAVAPSAEWQPSTDGTVLLQAIALRTGGQVLSLDSSATSDLFAAPSSAGNQALGSVHPIWQYPLVAALVIYLIDIAGRLGFNWRVGMDAIQHLAWWKRASS